MEPVTKERAHKKLGFSYLETAEVVVNLNELLVNYQTHFHKLQNFHWNVKGRDFFELHELFENMYKRAFNNIDDIAERIRVFGQTPKSTMAEYLQESEIKEARTDLSGEYMVREVIDDLETLIGLCIEVTTKAGENGDVGTVDLVNGMIKQIEKDHWMLTAWTKSLQTSPLGTAPAAPNISDN